VPSVIFLVEDDPNSLYYTKRILERSNYKVITAENGRIALEVLSQLDDFPEIIISDINMPEMNGYDFLKAVSDKPVLNQIPFLFLSVLDTPDDIRFGKMLGADDYITKPFEAEDLLAIIAGKITRNKKAYEYNNIINKMMVLELEAELNSSENTEHNISLFTVFWDDRMGPKLTELYPKNIDYLSPIDNLAGQLFQGAYSIYGNEDFKKAEGVLLKIKNINMSGYLFFDSYADNTFRSGERQYMIATVAPIINYLQSLSIKPILKKISLKIKKKETWQIKTYWNSIVDVLTKSS
jgi:DNA-binding response OmpR family regulator